ncbi:hypothetical protein GUJ93_ZPchr0012g21896 [Zizania palustris]|uniref:Uncharacterized protein n=1 Tax=Zizania palustris TaxID=103762 RepID=A0A8J5WQ34_ZIZPA|nr:hypothetical protein GUJ93_ZPchr0012g21896 [Zizania palustris]
MPPGPVAGTAPCPSPSPTPRHDIHSCYALNAHASQPSSHCPDLHGATHYLHWSAAHRHRAAPSASPCPRKPRHDLRDRRTVRTSADHPLR